MVQNETKKIVTDNKQLLVATIEYKNQIPIAMVKHGDKYDSVTLDSIASQLYGKKVHCIIEPVTE